MKNSSVVILIFAGLLCVILISGAEGDYIDSFDTSVQTSYGEGITVYGDYIYVLSISSPDGVFKYYINGTYISNFSVDTVTSLSDGITTNGTYFWLVDHTEDEVYKFLMNGTYAEDSFDIESQTSDGFGIATDNNYIWISDPIEDLVFKYTMGGVYVSNFSVSDEGAACNDLTTDGNNIWTVDSSEDKIFKYYMNGTYQDSFDISNECGAGFGITTNGTIIWVMDSIDKEVYKYEGGEGGEAEEEISINLTLVSPIDDASFSIAELNFTANYTTTTHYNFTNTTYYVWNSTGVFNNSVVVTITGINNQTKELIENFTLGNYEWNALVCWGNATFSNCSFAPSNYSFNVGAIINSVTYNEYVYETSSQTFIADINLLSGSEISLAQLIYNGTYYEISDISIDGDSMILNKTIDIPPNPYPFQNTTNPFIFSFTYTDVTSTNQNTTALNQNVSFINLQLCNTTYNTQSINFSVKDEITRDLIDPSANNTNAQASFEYWLGGGTEVKNYSFERLNSATNNTYEFCIFPNRTFKVNMDMVYSAQAHDERTYILRNASITNITSVVDLFLLYENFATKFTIEVRQGVSILTDAVVTVARFFVGEGTHRTVSIRETHSAGQFVEYLDLDNDYRYSIVKGGVLLGVINKKATCTEAPCEFTLQISEDIGNIFEGYEDTYARNIFSNISFDINTKIVTYDFIDITGLAQYFRLRVTQGFYNGTGNEICNQQMFSSSGSMTCNVTGYEGNFVAVGTVSRSPELIDQILEFVLGTLRDSLGLMAIIISFAIILTITIAGAVLSGGNPSMVLGGFGLGLLATKLMTLLPFSWGLVALFELVILIIMGWLKT